VTFALLNVVHNRLNYPLKTIFIFLLALEDVVNFLVVWMAVEFTQKQICNMNIKIVLLEM
jgi:hypothetical protein